MKAFVVSRPSCEIAVGMIEGALKLTYTESCTMKSHETMGKGLKRQNNSFSDENERMSGWMYSPKGEFASEPVDLVAPYLYKYEAVISNSMVEFAPKSLSVAFIIAISSFIPDFLLTPA